MGYIIDVFEQFYTIYLKQFELLIQNKNNTPIEDLKKQLHAIKPIFKMVGLTEVELMIEGIIKNNDIDCNTLKNMFEKKDFEKINSLIEIQIWDLKQAKLWKTKQYEK